MRSCKFYVVRLMRARSTTDIKTVYFAKLEYINKQNDHERMTNANASFRMHLSPPHAVVHLSAKPSQANIAKTGWQDQYGAILN